MNKEKNFKRGNRRVEEKREFEQKLVDLARVTRVTRGGKRLSFRACVVIGDEKTKVGYGVSKGADVQIAINKAVTQAKKSLIKPKIVEGTLPHEMKIKYKAARIMLRPGKAGRGIIAGGVVRTMLEMAGYKDAVAKIYGSKNKINNVKAVYEALTRLK
jgi:small subunit ribosomal protein S5